ncbi:hypothetical protein [Actinomadura madurae]|uniref:hypothetical protein n=1 Tax=Actinomadura madurae TaxID=1993 RepID=UPI003558D6FF
MTATSWISGSRSSASSTSRGTMFSPPDTTMPSLRPSTNSRPRWSMCPRSPVDSRPSRTSIGSPPV